MPDVVFIPAVIAAGFFVLGVTGFGSALVIVPLLSWVWPLERVVPLVILLDFAGSLLLGGLNRRLVDAPLLRRLLPWIVAGCVLGALLLTLPCLAALAAFALPTLRRSVSALIDWFTLLFFTGSALIIWIVWLAGVSGWPRQPAANLVRLLPGLDLRFSPWVFGLALAASLTWLALVAWRVGRHRSALWKSLVLPASGATLCWLLLMTLWLPMIDFARSYAPLVRNVATLMGHPDCVQAVGLSRAQSAALQHHGRMRVELSEASTCLWLVVGARAQADFEATPQAMGWRRVQTVRRPTDQYENLVLYERTENHRP